MFTNISGKFIITEDAVDQPVVVDNAEIADVKDVGEEVDVVEIPDCPDYQPTPMEVVRYLFGKFWWLWLVVLLAILIKKELAFQIAMLLTW